VGVGDARPAETDAAPAASASGVAVDALVTATAEGAYLFAPDERAGAFGFPGHKVAAGVVRGHLVLVTLPFAGRAGSGPARGGGGGGGGVGAGGGPGGGGGAAAGSGLYALGVGAVGGGGLLSVAAYDLRNKLVAFATTLPLAPAGASAGGEAGLAGRGALLQAVSAWGTWVVPAWGAAWVLAPGGALLRLSERATSAKLDDLFRLNLFDVAIGIARSAGYDAAALVDMHRSYGDHLFAKGDADGAMAQYVRTIGHVESSYVLRRFLDASRTRHLAAYLEALHAAGAASAPHTTLLLNCYTKLRDDAKLRAFLASDGSSAAAGAPAPAGAPRAPAFDVDTALRVLRDAGYVQEALGLAGRHGRHEAFVRLLVIDAPDAAEAAVARVANGGSAALAQQLGPAPDAAVAGAPGAAAPTGVARWLGASPYDVALAYLERLPFLLVERDVLQFGAPLLAARPDATTDLLMRLCVGFEPRAATASDALLGADVVVPALDAAGNVVLAPTAPRPPTQLLRADPAKFVPLFVDHPRQLKRFLHAVLRERTPSGARAPAPTAGGAAGGGGARPRAALWHALLELCLRADLAGAPGESVSAAALAAQRRAEALTGVLAHADAQYDPDVALVLCSAAGFDDGVAWLLDRSRHFRLIVETAAAALRRAVAAGAAEDADAAREALVAHARSYGDLDASLWETVLTALVETYRGSAGPGTAAEASTAEGEALTEALLQVESRGLLAPLEVVRLAARNPRVPLDALREYLLRALKRDGRTADAAGREAAEAATLARAMRRRIAAHQADSVDLRRRGVAALQDREARERRRRADATDRRERRGGRGDRGDRAADEDEDDRGGDDDDDGEAVLVAAGVLAGGAGGIGAGAEAGVLTPDEENTLAIRQLVVAKAAAADAAETFFSDLTRADDGFAALAEHAGRGLLDPRVLADTDTHAKQRAAGGAGAPGRRGARDSDDDD
jgi:hypothetical protein